MGSRHLDYLRKLEFCFSHLENMSLRINFSKNKSIPKIYCSSLSVEELFMLPPVDRIGVCIWSSRSVIPAHQEYHIHMESDCFRGTSGINTAPALRRLVIFNRGHKQAHSKMNTDPQLEGQILLGPPIVTVACPV